MTEKMLIYALGRGLEAYDRPAVKDCRRPGRRINTVFPAWYWAS